MKIFILVNSTVNVFLNVCNFVHSFSPLVEKFATKSVRKTMHVLTVTSSRLIQHGTMPWNSYPTSGPEGIWPGVGHDEYFAEKLF